MARCGPVPDHGRRGHGTAELAQRFWPCRPSRHRGHQLLRGAARPFAAAVWHRGRGGGQANRQSRRRTGKSDPADAVEAARAALSGRAQGAGKSKDGNVEAIRALVVAKRSARSTRIKTMNQIRHLGFTAPEELRERLKGSPART